METQQKVYSRKNSTPIKSLNCQLKDEPLKKQKSFQELVNSFKTNKVPSNGTLKTEVDGKNQKTKNEKPKKNYKLNVSNFFHNIFDKIKNKHHSKTKSHRASIESSTPATDKENKVTKKKYPSDDRSITHLLAKSYSVDSIRKMDNPNENEDLKLEKCSFSGTHFSNVQTIGKGAFSNVYLCLHNPTKKYVVVKEVAINDYKLMKKYAKNDNQNNPKKKKTYIREEEILIKLSTFRVPFTTRYYGCFSEGSKMHFVMKFYAGGELYSYIQANPMFPEKYARFYLCEVLVALFYMHDRMKLSYRDLKPENILLNRKGHIVLCDFGHAKQLKTGRKTRSFCGTPDYSAPELVQTSCNHDKTVDLWAFGVLVYEFLCGITPFFSSNLRDLRGNIINLRIDYPSHISPSAKDLISKLLIKTPSKRLGAKGITDIMNHHWFETISWDDVEHKRIPVPFSPQLTSQNDLKYFSMELNSENIKVFEFDQINMD